MIFLPSSFAEVGKHTFLKVCKSQILKFLGYFHYRNSANSFGVPVSKWQNFYDNPQIPNLHISTKNWTTLSQNSSKSCIFRRFLLCPKFKFSPATTLFYLQGEKGCGSFKSANHKKIWSANRNAAKCDICGKSSYLTPPAFGWLHAVHWLVWGDGEDLL